MTAAYAEEGILLNSSQFDGLNNLAAMEKITDYLASLNLGKKTVNYRLRDWGISRQRYWGTPIPIIYCDKCGTVPVPEKDLPVILPLNLGLKEEGGSPLASFAEFVETSGMGVCSSNGNLTRRTSSRRPVSQIWSHARQPSSKALLAGRTMMAVVWLRSRCLEIPLPATAGYTS